MDISKIITRIFGGIGNQLFCYAAARRLAQVNKAELVIDDVGGFIRDGYKRFYQLDHFNIHSRKATARERLVQIHSILRYFKHTINQRRPFEQRAYIRQEGIDFDPRLLQVRPRGTVYLEGYWQSENYFKDIEATIRKDLRITPPTDSVNLKMAECILGTDAVAVHVRFFDSPDEAGSTNAPRDYYSRAAAKMELMVPDAHYFVFSDRPEDARARIPLPDKRVTCISHNRGDLNAFADLWLMTLCKHFIIANSTFSWWGAWLASHTNKRVITPGFEVREGKMSWGFEGLLPGDWIKL